MTMTAHTLRRTAPGIYETHDGEYRVVAWNAERFGAEAGTTGFRLWDIYKNGERIGRSGSLSAARDSIRKWTAR